jgi:hypothetical protein
MMTFLGRVEGVVERARLAPPRRRAMGVSVVCGTKRNPSRMTQIIMTTAMSEREEMQDAHHRIIISLFLVLLLLV